MFVRPPDAPAILSISPAQGIILIASYDSDLGDANERASGYFDRAFDYDAMRRNCDFVAAVAAARDALVDIDIQARILLRHHTDWSPYDPVRVMLAFP